MKISTIYTITNSIDNKIYIGCTEDYITRKYNHIRELRNNKHKNTYLQNAWNKYGEENFKFEILEECSPNLLYSLEHYWVNILDTRNIERGYNIGKTDPISGATKGMLGKKHTIESLYKISKNRKGKAVGENNFFYGRKHSEETRKKMSEKRKGIKISEETKRKISDKLKGRLPKNIDQIKGWSKGKKLSKEFSKKISEISKKKICQYDLNNNLIKCFSCAKDAANELGLNYHSEIARCARNKRKSAHNYIWKYYDKR